ncbi:hypothetical protein GFY24_25545 [Nocardia sp. SYP-A9097]|uniref:hypothetical protein n=1 Tax=Nocardia sp. SYP-A9097 TaxID=2663237 RepID=UPI00129A5C06|nr:hypothetical protein [Nocardia sp. SYP-A9097]MRH90763.1 hypothetical protein [Nocardia sp. SYP-A9097]
MTVRVSAAVIVISATISALLCGLGAPPAQADPLPQWTPFGTTLYTFGDANFCTGAIGVALEATPQLPGHVLAHVTPYGYQHGPCGNHVVLGWLGSAGGRSQDVYIHTDATPGNTVTVDLWVGMGPAKFIVNTWPLQGPFLEWYLLVP